MAKDDKKKVKSRASTKYATSSDEDNSSDDEDSLLALFANLNMQQKEKLNELIGAIHEKDELLDSREDFLIKENKKHVKVKNAYAQEVEKCEKITSELSTCHNTISNLRFENAKLIAKVEKLNVCDDSLVNLKNDNANLIAKIDKFNGSIASLKIKNDKLITKSKNLNVCNDIVSNLKNKNVMLHAKIDELNVCKPSTSTVAHVSICTRCRDVNVDAIHDHLALIKQKNDHIAQLTSKINEHEIENENFKFARSMLYSGRRPGIKDGIGFQQGGNVKLNAPRNYLILLRVRLP
jgi:chromosome segregation ATPase